jgi:Na+/H+ antiporter NhaA
LVLTSKGQLDALFSLVRASEAVTAPLLRLEHALQHFSAFLIVPLLALSNVGVSMTQRPAGKSVASPHAMKAADTLRAAPTCHPQRLVVS